MGVSTEQLAKDLWESSSVEPGLNDNLSWSTLTPDCKKIWRARAAYLMERYSIAPKVTTYSETVANAAKRGYAGT